MCSTPGIRSLLVSLIVAAVIGVSGPAAATPPDTASTGDTMLTVPVEAPAATGGPTVDTDNDFIDLERDLSECVGNSLSKPGCGREPTHSGDRGSAIQWTVFGLMAAGIAFIGWRIVAGARRSAPDPRR